MKIILIRDYITAKKYSESHEVFATVEAEYGQYVIEGKNITLAHHVEKYKNHKAPCLYPNRETTELAEDDEKVILISHVDLDTVGGCLAIMGKKPENESFWHGAAYIDVNGYHCARKLSITVQNQINAYKAWYQNNAIKNDEKIYDVTEYIQKSASVISDILLGREEYILKGRKMVNLLEEKYEEYLVYEDQNIRAFQTSGLSTISAYYSPTYMKNSLVTITFYLNHKSIVLAFSEKGYRADLIVKDLWGDLAGGHESIAGSPRGRKMNQNDFEEMINYVKEVIQRKK